MARELLYKKSETEMRRRILSGDWAVGKRLGNEFELADEFKVSQGTMRRALMALEADGLLSRKPGRGTVVAAAAPKPAAATPKALRTRGGDAVAFDIHRAKSSVRVADGEDAALFGAVELYVAERLLKVAGARAALEELVIPSHLTEGFDDETSANLEAALEAHGLAAVAVEDRLRAELTSMGDSVALSCDRSTPLLSLTRLARDASGTALARQTLRVADPNITYS